MELGKKVTYIVTRVDNGFVFNTSDGKVMVFNTAIDIAKDIADGVLGAIKPGMEIEFTAKRNK